MNPTSRFSHFGRLLVSISVVSLVAAQNVGIGTPTPDPSAKVEVYDTARGILIPRLTSSQINAITNPAVGLLVFNIDCKVFQYWDGIKWITITTTEFSSSLSITGEDTLGSLCLPDTLYYSVSGSGSSPSYTWSVTGGATIISGQGTSTVAIAFPDTFSGGVICVSDSCASACLDIVVIQPLGNTLFFDYVSNAPQTWTVPAGVHCVKVKVWGGGGGGGGYDAANCSVTSNAGGAGGGGAYVEANLSVNAGDVLTLYVASGGGGGDGCSTCNSGGTGGWGWSSGGNGACRFGSGGGGGSSAVLLNGNVRVVAAGGGGGGGAGNNGNGGNGGGGDQNGFPSAGGAAGGTAGAAATPDGENAIAVSDGGASGGGGGGWQGGTIGQDGNLGTNCDCGGGGGGGGSSYCLANQCTITPGNANTPGNATDPDLCPGCATGGAGGTSASVNGQSGGNGRIVIIY